MNLLQQEFSAREIIAKSIVSSALGVFSGKVFVSRKKEVEAYPI